MLHQMIINFEPRRFLQNPEHLNIPSIKGQVQRHVANRLKLLCISEHFGPISVEANLIYNRLLVYV